MKTIFFLMFTILSMTSCDILQNLATTTTSPVPGYTGRIGCSRPMTSTEMSTFESALKAYTFENKREEMCKQMISGKCFTVAQVRSVVSLFEFENKRLGLLKAMYHNTYDIDNYTQLLNMLDFENNKQELHKYVLS